MAIINPAISHPEVVIQAIAARSAARASAFAAKHSIPDTYTSYQALIDSPTIDVVFIPLPNSLHFEWAVRALRAGKHVLLEKPSVDTASEAERLFGLPELKGEKAPVLLEAFHARFHPAVHKFLQFVSPEEVVRVETESMIPWWLARKDGIEFNFDMGGGSMMQLGTYNMAILRMVFGAEPVECVTCETGVLGDGVHDRCDSEFKASFRFPNGGIGEARTTLQGPTLWKPSEAKVTHREVVVADDSLPAQQEKLRTRVVTLHGFIQAIVWHRIDVRDSYVVRDKESLKPVKSWVESSTHKAYSYAEGGMEGPGNKWWTSYHYQLEEFVNRVRGRKTKFWISAEDSVSQAKMVDMAYEKSGLGLRPNSTFE